MSEKLNENSIYSITENAEFYKFEEAQQNHKMQFRIQIRDYLLDKGYSRRVIDRVLQKWGIKK